MIQYPKSFLSKEKLEFLIRPRKKSDKILLQNFFKYIPKDDLIIYNQDAADFQNIEDWFIDDLYTKDLELITLHKKDIVAKGTIHSEGIYWENAAELKVIVKPEYRGQGIGSFVFNLLIYEIFERNIQKVIVRYNLNNINFIKIINHYGFKPETILRSNTDLYNTKTENDLIIASYNLENWVRRFEYYNLFLSNKQ